MRHFALAITVGMMTVGMMLGCGGSGIDAPALPDAVVDAEGTVTKGGQPLDGALVVFMPESEGAFVGRAVTDSSGHYVIEMQSGSEIKLGVPKGSYRVMISRMLKPDGSPPMDPTEPPAMSGATESLPPQYSSPTDSKLRAAVGASSGTFDFKLK